jgi:hypothetical protein
VDHAWTFRAADARAQLAAMPPLLRRVAAMAGVRLPPDADDVASSDDEGDAAGADSASESGGDGSCDDEAAQEAGEREAGLRPVAWRGAVDAASLPDRVLASAWRLCGHYRLGSDVEATWYLVDEFGAALQHSAQPSLALVPFLYAPSGTTSQPPQAFSLAWPVRALREGDEATRDTLLSVPPGKRRQALLACLFRTPRSRRSAQDAAFADALRRWGARQAEAAASPVDDKAPAATSAPLPMPPLPLRVFTDIDWVADHLRRPEFGITEHASDADVLWLKAPGDDAAAAALGARPGVLLNQFPGEEALVFKHLLPRTAAAAEGALGEHGWLPQTFDAAAELDAMLGAHAIAVKAGETPLWYAAGPTSVPGLGRVVLTLRSTQDSEAVESGALHGRNRGAVARRRRRRLPHRPKGASFLLMNLQLAYHTDFLKLNQSAGCAALRGVAGAVPGPQV